MAYDEGLAERVRRLVAGRPGVSEKAMFGGLAFLLDGKMFCGVNKDELMVRVGPDRYEEALARPHVRPMDFTGKPMKGYVFVALEGCKTARTVGSWVKWSMDFVASLEHAPRKKTKQSGGTRNAEVDAWLERYTSPMKPVVTRVRDIVLGADPRVEECIKWQAPTFVYKGNIASFFPKSKQHASLMFHQGALIPGRHPRLEGEAETGRSLKIASVKAADEARGDIEAIVRAWCAWRDAESGAAPAKKAKRRG